MEDRGIKKAHSFSISRFRIFSPFDSPEMESATSLGDIIEYLLRLDSICIKHEKYGISIVGKKRELKMEESPKERVLSEKRRECK